MHSLVVCINGMLPQSSETCQRFANCKASPEQICNLLIRYVRSLFAQIIFKYELHQAKRVSVPMRNQSNNLNGERISPIESSMQTRVHANVRTDASRPHCRVFAAAMNALVSEISQTPASFLTRALSKSS